jgi:hypothetical protein
MCCYLEKKKKFLFQNSQRSYFGPAGIRPGTLAPLDPRPRRSRPFPAAPTARRPRLPRVRRRTANRGGGRTDQPRSAFKPSARPRPRSIPPSLPFRNLRQASEPPSAAVGATGAVPHSHCSSARLALSPCPPRPHEAPTPPCEPRRSLARPPTVSTTAVSAMAAGTPPPLPNRSPPLACCVRTALGIPPVPPAPPQTSPPARSGRRESLPCATDRWDQGARCQLLKRRPECIGGVRVAYWVGWIFDLKKKMFFRIDLNALKNLI